MFGEIKSCWHPLRCVTAKVRRQGRRRMAESNVVTVTPVAARAFGEASGFQPRNLPRCARTPSASRCRRAGVDEALRGYAVAAAKLPSWIDALPPARLTTTGDRVRSSPRDGCLRSGETRKAKRCGAARAGQLSPLDRRVFGASGAMSCIWPRRGGGKRLPLGGRAGPPTGLRARGPRRTVSS